MKAKNKYLPFILLFLAVFISRLPFLSAGFGVEEDSWGIALAAFHTKTTGIYEPSRFPGHPVQELIYSVLWGTGPFLFNLLCAFFSALAALFFALILRHLKFNHFFLAAFAFSFVPVIFISSTYTIDFMWSEAFILMSFYFLLKEKLVLTGILLGLAVGCRITSGVMLLPFMIVIWEQGALKENALRFFKLAASMGIIALLAFLPLMLQFGTSFFMYYDQFPYPPLTKVLYKMTIGVFGFIGMATLVLFTLVLFIRKGKSNSPGSFAQKPDRRIILACFSVLILYVISYFRLPQKSGYLIPAIPFVILLFGYYLSTLQFRILCFSLIASSFICSINLTDKLRGAAYSKAAFTFTVSGQQLFFDVLSGPIFSDYSKRKQKMRYTDEVIAKTVLLDKKTIIIAGWWYNEIMVTALGKANNQFVVFEPYIPENKMKKYLEEGYVITYLPEQNIYNDQMYEMNCTNDLAEPFEQINLLHLP